MKNKKKGKFILPSHYAPCIDKYEIDLTSGCSVQCCYCSLKDKRSKKTSLNDILQGEIPADIREKGIYLSPNCDPFSSSAQDTAHEVLARFLPDGVPFLIITKNHIPQRTIDLLARYPSQVYVQISLSRLDDELNAYIEPGAASADERLQTIRNLVDAGIRVTPILMPLFPYIDDIPVRNLWEVINACAATGAKYLKAAYVIINPHDAVQMQKLMGNDDIEMSLRYLTEKIKIHIGEGLTAQTDRRIKLYKMLTYSCSEFGMKFQACPILDPAVLDMDNVGICATYRKKQKSLTKKN
jgi:DNA repair photolyase